MGQTHAEFRNVVRHIVILRPDLTDPERTLAKGRVVVDGRIVTNPNALVRSYASLRVLPARPLRGEDKLRAALDAFGVPVPGRVALDLGAAAGGLTTVLLERGAHRVYAVDPGHGSSAGHITSPIRGSRGTREWLVHRRCAGDR
jgi:predicted rRNA methylase YqxC with S4 and FtsJ domains